MLNLTKAATLSKHEKKIIKSLGCLTSSHWESGTKDNIHLKENIKRQMLKNQNDKCAYCNLNLYETSRPEIEHIAPKHKYPQFQYTSKNLVMACQFCNSSSKKGQFDTIDKYNSYYNMCQFGIIHPYYDDPDKYLDQDEAIIKIKMNLDSDSYKKARKTLDWFRLTETKQVEARAKQLIFDETLSNNPDQDRIKKIVNQVSSYKP